MDINREIEQIVKILKNSGTFLYPTDTVWGLGCDASNDLALEKLIKIKVRSKKGFIILVDSKERLKNIVSEIPSFIEPFLEEESPTTIVYPNVKGVSKLALANDSSIAIRLTKNEFCKQIINKLDAPIISTSANFHEKPTPKEYHQINPKLIEAVDYVCEFGRNKKSNFPPSSLYKFSAEGKIIQLR